MLSHSENSATFFRFGLARKDTDTVSGNLLTPLADVTNWFGLARNEVLA
jgi:hypothetical protein